MVRNFILTLSFLFFVLGVIALLDGQWRGADTLLISSVIFIALGKVLSLLQGIHLYNRILTEKMAGSELAKYVMDNKLDNGSYTITNKDRKRYEKMVAEDGTKKFLGS